MSVLFFPKIAPKVFDQKNPASLEVPTLDAMALTTSAFSVSFSVRGGPWLCWSPVFFFVNSRKDGDMQGGPMLCYKWSYKMGNWDYNPTYMGVITPRPTLVGIVFHFEFGGWGYFDMEIPITWEFFSFRSHENEEPKRNEKCILLLRWLPLERCLPWFEQAHGLVIVTHVMIPMEEFLVFHLQI